MEGADTMQPSHIAARTQGFNPDTKVKLAFDRSVRRFDEFGRMHVATTNISKANICPYYGWEIPNHQQLGLDANRVYKLLRHPDELARAARTFNGVPLMSEHIPHTAGEPHHRVVVGTIGSDAQFNGQYLKSSLVVWDADAIAMIEDGERKQLSAAYAYDADMTAGIYNGKRYDGVMRNLRGNHVALVIAGRTGADVVVGDRKLEVHMPNKGAATLSRKAVMVAGALQAYLHPKLAADGQIDLRHALKGTTAANYADRKPMLAARVMRSCSGQLAQDISRQELISLLDMLEGDDTSVGTQPDPDPDDDGDTDDDGFTDMASPTDDVDADRDPDDDAADVTPAGQDIPPEAEPETDLNPEGEAPAEPDASGGGAPLDKALAFLKDLIRPEDLAMVQHILKPETPAPAEPVAQDAPKMTLPAAKGMVTKQAMDAAIAAATKATERATVQRMNGIAEAKSFVKPWVGDLAVAMDSAETVYRTALETLGVDGVKTLHPSAFKAVLSAQPKPGETVRRQNGTAVAMDAAQKSKYNERFPHANRLVSR